jgi:hypothetical protein
MENFSTDMENMLHNDDKRRHDRNSLLKNCATHQSLDSILEVDINFGNQYQVIIKTKKKYIYICVKWLKNENQLSKVCNWLDIYNIDNNWFLMIDKCSIKQDN